APSFDVRKIRITGCGKNYCYIPVNSTVYFSLEFFSYISSKNLIAQGIFFPKNIPPSTNLIKVDACKHITRGCPISPRKYLFKISITIPPWLKLGMGPFVLMLYSHGVARPHLSLRYNFVIY
ncbi:hypothetical protein MXB_3763, partial [Myxobolus squamalis]